MSIFRSGHDCLLDGHRFEARYDEEPRDGLDVDLNSFIADDIRTMTVLQRYVRDVCVRCGKTIERSGPA
jgi:hypothetical protein